MSGWIKAVTIIEAAHLASFDHVMEECVSGNDAVYWTDDQLGVNLDTDHDEFWFRMALLHETSIPEIHRVDDRSYIMTPRFLDEVRAVMDRGTFACQILPLTVIYLELAHATSLCAINDGLAAARSLFGDQAPDLVAV